MARLDQHINRRRYCTVPRTLCFVTSGDDVLLIRGAPDKRTWPDRYNGVGGHVESHEDVVSAARREIIEETGLHVDELRLRGIANIPAEAGDIGVLLLIFTAVASDRALRPSPEGALEWVARNRLAEYDLVDDLRILLPRLLGAPNGDTLFFAHYGHDEHGELQIQISEEGPWHQDPRHS